MNTMLQSRGMRCLYPIMLASILVSGCRSKDEQSSSQASSQPVSTSPVQSGKTKTTVPGKSLIAEDSSTTNKQKRGVAAAKPSKGKTTPSVAAPSSLSASSSPVMPDFSKWPDAGEGLDLLAVAAVGSLNALEEVISLVNGAPKKKGEIAKEAVADFQKKFGIKDASWLRKDAPMYVLLSDIKDQDGGRGLILPIGDAKAFKKALAGFKKKGSKHSAELLVDGAKAYVDSVGDQAVITYSDDFFSRLKPYLEGPFKTYKANGVVELRLNVTVLRAMYGNDLSGSKAWIKSGMAELMGLDGSQGPQGKSLEDLVDLLQSFVASVSEASFALTLDKNEMAVLCGIVPEQGQPLERMVKSMATLRSDLTSSLQTNALVAFGGRTDNWTSDEGGEQSDELISRLASVITMTAQEKKELKTHFDATFKNQMGDAIFQLYQDGEFPLAMGGVSGVNDAKAERQSHQGIIDVAFKLLMANLKTRMKDNRMASLFLNSKSFGQLFGSMSMLTTPMGIGLAVSSSESDGTLVDSFTVTMDWKKSPLAARIPNVETIQKVVGDSLSVAAAYRGKRAAIAFGPNAVEHAKKMVGEKAAKNASRMAQALTAHSVAGEVRLAAISKLLLKYTGNRAPSLLALSAMDDNMALQLRAKSNGSKAVFRVSVPTPVFRALR